MDIIFSIIILIFSVIVHEVAHGYAAFLLGDKTAYYQGRLTLNPLSHLDPLGSVILPALMYMSTGMAFGWAKPVPYNPYNLRNQRTGELIVALAGPGSNLAIAVLFGLALRFVALPMSAMTLIATIVLVNIVLCVFNMVPIPPLDGSKVVFSVLPYQYNRVRTFLEQYGLVLVLLFAFVFWPVLNPIILGLFKLITGFGL